MQNIQEIMTKFFSDLKKLQLENKPTLNLTSYFFAGFSSHNYFGTPKGLSPLFDAFFMLQKLEDSFTVIDTQKRSIFLTILKTPEIRVEKELNKLLVYTGEDEEYNEDEFSDLLTKIESLIETNTTSSEVKLEPIDLIFWGFITHGCTALCSELFEKIEKIRIAQVTEELTQEQKTNIFISLYSNLEFDLQAYLQKVKEENPFKLKSPSTSAGSDEIEETKENKEIKECTICLEAFADESAKYRMEMCGHMFYKTCLGEFIKGQIGTNKFPVFCPQDSCKAEFTNFDLKNVLTDEEVKRFYELSIAFFVNNNINVAFHCPTPDCKFKLFEKNEPKQTDVTCPLCFRETCLACKETSHPNAPCEVNQFMNIAKDLALKACPSCRHWVEKIEGCNHMTCNCGHEFCYNCGRNYYAWNTEEDGALCSNGLCYEDNYYEDFEKLLSLTEG